jgi:GR25 family glycosyltransferase involved in LPS biosynthesis
MNIFLNSFSPNIIQKIFYHIHNRINAGDILAIYSNTACDSLYLANVKVTFVEIHKNIEEFIIEKNINMVITNVVHDYMLKSKEYMVVILNNPAIDSNVYFYKDIPLLINKFKQSKQIINTTPDSNISNTCDNSNKIEEIKIASSDIFISKNKKTHIDKTINIFINNMSSNSIHKVLNILNESLFQNNVSENCLTIYSNHKIDISAFKIIYLENTNDNVSICNFINDKNINIFITNFLDNYMLDCIKHCYIVSLMLLPSYPSIYFYKNLPDIIFKCKSKLANLKKNGEVVNDCQIINNKDNTKELYRNICLRYLDNFRKLKIPDLHLHLNNEAVFIEYRIIPHIEVLIRNMIYNLGSSWSYTIVCGNTNFSFMKEICENISNNIKIINTNFNNLNQNEYTNMLCTTEFWDLFVGEKILIHQEDACIFRKDMEQYLEFDYVGGAFALDCVTPINVGNGGFSLRTKSIMKSIIERMPPKDFIGKCKFSNHYKKINKLDLYPEDNYYPQAMQDLKIGKVAPHNICKMFSSEQIFTENCLGMHCMWFSNQNWENYIINYFDGVFKDANKNNSITKSSHYNKTLDVYFIHCDEFKDRDCKIQKAKKQLEDEYGEKYNIRLFKGVNTSIHDLSLENQIKTLQEYDPNLTFDDPEKFTFYKGGQIGCYLGHHLIIQNIAKSITNSDYSVIFEDDIVLKPNFTNSIVEIITYFESINETFDVIYLGHLNDNTGTKKHENIYNLNKLNWNFGAHGLLINNKSATNLYKYNCNILHEIDNQYKLLYNTDLIKAFYVKNPLVFQDRTIFSYINLKKNNFG